MKLLLKGERGVGDAEEDTGLFYKQSCSPFACPCMHRLVGDGLSRY